MVQGGAGWNRVGQIGAGWNRVEQSGAGCRVKTGGYMVVWGGKGWGRVELHWEG